MKTLSMVMPCHNKIKYIGNMLRSVYEQTWSDIQLIMVNDGSTDGSRQVMGEWAERLTARGYEVVIVDKENGGIQTAVLEGMKHVTGDFFCSIDCDDELHPEYAAKLAGFLYENPDYDIACSHYAEMEDTIDNRKIKVTPLQVDLLDTPHLLESFLLQRVHLTTWIYVVRTSYFKKCGLPGNFPIQPQATQEPGFLIPIAAGGGKKKYFPDALYYHNHGGRAFIMKEQLEKWPHYGSNYIELCKKTIELLDKPKEEKKRLLSIFKLGAFKFDYVFNVNYKFDPKGLEKWENKVAEQVNKSFVPSPQITPKNLRRYGPNYMWRALEDCIFKKENPFSAHFPQRGRVIGYGALGKKTPSLIVLTRKTPLKIDELWDINAREDSRVAGYDVRKPDFSSVTSEDILLIFPAAIEIKMAVHAALPKGVTPLVLDCEQIIEYEHMCALKQENPISLRFRQIGRVIGYGALGKRAPELISLTHNTQLKMNELWDANAQEGNRIAGYIVRKPDFASVTSKDVFLMFPDSVEIKMAVCAALPKGVAPLMLNGGQIKKYRHMWLYPQFYNGCKHLEK